MEKKEFPKLKIEDTGPELGNIGGGLKPKISNFTRRLFIFTKLALGICLLPVVYCMTVAFLKQFSLVGKTLENYFWWGIVAFLVIYLFIWEPVKIYTRGQKILEWVFSFFKPLVRVAPYLLPIYTIIILIAYWISTWFNSNLLPYFIFLFGFSMALHLVFSAKTMRAKKEDSLKANYIFGFSLIYILNLVLLSLCLNAIFDKFSFVAFSIDSFQTAQDIFNAAFTQLFVIK